MRGRLFALVVSMLALLATSPAVSAGSPVRSFTYVPTSFWAHGPVLLAVLNDLMSHHRRTVSDVISPPSM